tara:strand:+ start:6909 stop:7166 length:258 start_codon:yes stop_codon:yes gene_type:complete
MRTTEKLIVKWQNSTRKLLVGKTIKHIRYLNDEEMDAFAWYHRPIVIVFTDGSLLIPQQDDEGNDGGAMFFQDKDGNQDVIPVIY